MKFTQGIYIDGTYYDVPLVSVKRKAPFLDKYAQRVESGDLKRELIGVYFNYEMSMGNESDCPDGVYESLYSKLTEAEEFHTLKIPEFSSAVEFKAYCTEVDDEWDRVTSAQVTYKNLTVKFIAKTPRNVPA